MKLYIKSKKIINFDWFNFNAIDYKNIKIIQLSNLFLFNMFFI